MLRRGNQTLDSVPWLPRQLVVTRSQRRAAEKQANPFRPRRATLCTLCCQAVCIITFDRFVSQGNPKICFLCLAWFPDCDWQD